MLVLNNSCHKNMWMIFEGCHRLYNIHIFEALFLHVVAGDWFWIFPPHEQNALPWIIPVQMSRCLKSAYSYLIIEQRDNVPLSLCSMWFTHLFLIVEEQKLAPSDFVWTTREPLVVHSPILDASLVNHHVVHMKSESASRGCCGCGTQPTWRLFFGLMVPPWVNHTI